MSSAATADHLQVHSCSFTVCTASCLLNMLVIPWPAVQVLSCLCSCAVLPFLVRTWSGLAHANGIKSPSTSMSSPYSQCALWGARVVPGVSLPWSLPSCSPSLPSSQTSLVTQAAFSLLLLQPCRNCVQMLPVVGPVQISWAWHVHKSVLRSTLSSVKFDGFVKLLDLLPAVPSLLDGITGEFWSDLLVFQPCGCFVAIDAAMLMMLLSEDWPVLLGVWPAPSFQPHVFAALHAAMLKFVIQDLLLVSGRNITCFLGPLLGVSPWLLDLRLSLFFFAFPSALLRRSFWEGMIQSKEVVKESLFAGPSCLFPCSQAIMSAVFLAGVLCNGMPG